MTCRQVTALLDAFLDGELPADQTLSVEEHLSSCNTCGELLRLDSALRTSMKSAVRAASVPSVGFEERLNGALRAERERMLEARPSARPAANKRVAGAAWWLAMAAAVSGFAWILARPEPARSPVASAPRPATPEPTGVAAAETPEQALDELVRYHATPPEPQITEPSLVQRLEPEVGVPVHVPALKQYGASWEGGGVVPMKNQRAALFRYRVSNHPVTVYVYDARRMPLRSVLEPRVVHNQPVHVGERHGYSIAALEQRGVGYAVATDLNDDESAELVTTMY